MKVKKLFVALFVVIMSLVATGSSFAQARDSMTGGESLARGESLYSPNGNYKLILQDDGNLVLYKVMYRKKRIRPNALWNSGTVGRAVKQAVMQKDGNFVLYDYEGRPLWNSKTSHVKNIDGTLEVQNDGNLVIYRPNRTPIWDTKTNEY